MATVQRLNDSGSWVDVTDYGKWVVEHGTSPVVVVPSATLRAVDPDVAIDANDRIRIQDSGGSTFFEGKAATAGKYDQFGQRDIPVDGIGTELFSERVTQDIGGDVTTKSVLDIVLALTESGGDWTLNYAATPVSLNNDYNIENRGVKAVFRDMMDRAGTVWWVDTVNLTIHVNTLGGRGSFAAVETGVDDVAVKEWDEGNVEVVRNDVEVVGTGDVRVTGGYEDGTSIGDYGRRSAKYNYEYVTEATEATNLAEELAILSPLESGTLLAGDTVGDITQNLSNYTLDVTDDARGIVTTGIAVEKATLQEGRAKLELGEGAGVSLENLNRKSKSRDDLTDGGSVFDSGSIAEGAIDTLELAQDAVKSAIIDAGAVLNEAVADAETAGGGLDGSKMADGFLDNLSRQLGDVWPGGDQAIGLTEDSSGEFDYVCDFEEQGGLNDLELGYDSTPDLFTLEEGTADFQVGDSGSPITGVFTDELVTPQITPDSLGADIGASDDEFDFVWAENVRPDLDNEGTIGAGDGTTAERAYSEVHTYNLYEYTPAPLSPDDPRHDATTDGGSVIDREELLTSTWRDPPDYAAQRHVEGDEYEPLPESDGGERGVEMGHMANYLLETCKAQERTIQTLKERVAALEQAKD